MTPNFRKLMFLGTASIVAALQFSNPAAADPPVWANAKRVKATSTICDGRRYLLLKGNSVNASTRSNAPGCASSEETFLQVNVSKTFFHGSKGDISASHVDAGYISCANGAAIIINLGAPGEAARAIREHPAPQGCTYTTRQYQYVSSVGHIPFTTVANGGTMTVAESLAMHAKERERAIAECNASPACRAEVSRMRSYSGSGSGSNPCIGNGNYANYNGSGSCTDSNGNRDPRGTLVEPH